MNKVTFLISAAILILVTTAGAQTSRTAAMGNLQFTISDRDRSFNPYDMAGNPAWMEQDEQSEWLDITPSAGHEWGDYRKPFSAKSIDSYSTGVVGVKPLGSSGTFRGMAVYSYEMRNDYYRSLKKDTYAGESFYFTDTTSGNFRYNGPTFNFMHSLELFDDFYAGASVEYRILDGLKKVYTYAETLYRNVSGNLGVAYRVNENLVVAANGILWNGQERITADDVNLRTVETFHYRGENYRLALLGSSQDYKLKKNGWGTGAQVYWKNDIIETGISGNYNLYNTSVLFPKGNFTDVEDGYTSFENYYVDYAARVAVSSSITVGIAAGMNHTDSWSRNTPRDVILWDWDLKDYYAGAGMAFALKESGITAGIEYEYHSIAADSSKYIDKKEISLDGVSHIIRVGVEKYVSPVLALRAGYNLESMEYDLVTGGKDINYNVITTGLGYTFPGTAVINFGFDYSIKNNSSDTSLFRSNWRAFAALRLFTF